MAWLSPPLKSVIASKNSQTIRVEWKKVLIDDNTTDTVQSRGRLARWCSSVHVYL